MRNLFMPNETNEKMGSARSGSLLESLTGSAERCGEGAADARCAVRQLHGRLRCDLMADRMEVIKRKNFSHCAQEKGRMRDALSYSEWIRHAFETFVVKGTAPGLPRSV